MLFITLVTICISTSLVAQKWPPRPPDRVKVDKNDPGYLEQAAMKQQKAGKTLTIIGSSAIVTGTVLKLIGNSKANAPNHADWAGFGEQVFGIGAILVGNVVLGVGIGFLHKSKATKKRMMKLQPAVSINTMKYSVRRVYQPAVGIKISL